MREKPIVMELSAVTGYTVHGNGIVLGKVEKDKPSNAIWVDENHPKADFIFNFLDTPEQAEFDWIRAFDWIRNQTSVLDSITKMLKNLKQGGYMIIVESVKPSGKCHFNYAEMEGILRMFESKCFVETHGINKDVYWYVCTKKREVADEGNTGEAEVTVEKT